MLQEIMKAYETQFQVWPSLVVRAPGRVNLIGEHTDYNDGFVLPMAIDRAIWIALRPRRDRKVRIYSVHFNETQTFDLDDLQKGDHDWVEYVKGVAWALQNMGHALKGWDGAVTGNVPLGAGLSSSAAIEMAVARAFAASSKFRLSKKDMALRGQLAENKWVGVNCGIMDQMVSACGEEGRALLIDCRSLELTHAPLPGGTVVVILDTATRRGLEGSAYNERRRQCEEGANLFGVTCLRDVSVEQFEERAFEMSDVARRRCRHVITENARTLEAVKAMQAGDARAFGQLMNQSHTSLRNDFEVSCPQLDIMADIAQKTPGCFGARMTGAGFGGCAVALVDKAQVEAFVKTVHARYQQATNLEPHLYVCQPTAGAQVVYANGC
ncbi:MAG: galactokinase [Candidatus Sumerlaeota bacterium]|nr:galactokinase [Candidatus Sumerlaeota bacterium]